jgi:hypothetical protein
MTPILRERRGDVAELHVLAENELIQLRENSVFDAAVQRQQMTVAEPVHVDVGDHPPLRRQAA